MRWDRSLVGIREVVCFVCHEDYALGVHDLRLYFRGRPVCSWHCMGRMWDLWFKALKALGEVDASVVGRHPEMVMSFVEATRGGVLLASSSGDS